jgi:hypothetical protein
MDRRLRRAPDAEWVLMYRLGLSRARIAGLVGAEPAAVGYHLAIARRQDPGLETEHQAAASAAAVPSPSAADLVRMDEVIGWVTAHCRFPVGRAADRDERSMARWLTRRRRDAAHGALDPAYRDGLARIPGWLENPKEVADAARWHDRLAQLAAYRQEGNDWPRHQGPGSKHEHTLGVWIHTQRYTCRRGSLDPVKVRLLDDMVPGWQTGRVACRRDRRNPERGTLRNRCTIVDHAGRRS